MSPTTLAPETIGLATVSKLKGSRHWGIRLPDGSLYREPSTRMLDPHNTEPATWREREQAEAEARMVSEMLADWYGAPDAAELVAVVRIEWAGHGWQVVAPVDPDTGRVAGWPCDSSAALSIDQAHRVMQEHIECAGLIPCRIRARARGVLGQAGRVVFNHNPAIWASLHLPDQAQGR